MAVTLKEWFDSALDGGSQQFTIEYRVIDGDKVRSAKSNISGLRKLKEALPDLLRLYGSSNVGVSLEIPISLSDFEKGGG